MGSYNRITIALFLLVFLASVGRGAQGHQRGDGVLTPIANLATPIADLATSSSSSNTSTPNASTPTPSTPPEDTSTELHTETVTTLITEESSKTTPTQQTLTSSRSAPDSTNGITQNAVWTTLSREATPAALRVTTAHSGVTEDTGNGTGVDGSTDGEGFTTHEVDTTSTPTTSTPTQSTPTTSTPTLSTSTPSTPTPSTSTLSTPLGENEVVTEIGTTSITEESSRTTPTQQTLTRSTSAPDSTNGITQNAVWTTVSREAKPAALGVTIVHSGVTEDIGTGTEVDVSTGGEGFTTREVDTTSTPTVSTPTVSTPTVSTPTASTPTPSTPTPSTSTPSTSTPSTPPEDNSTELYTETVTTVITEESSKTTPTNASLLPATSERATTAPLQTSPLTTSLCHQRGDAVICRPTSSSSSSTSPPTSSTSSSGDDQDCHQRQRGDGVACRPTTSSSSSSTSPPTPSTSSSGDDQDFLQRQRGDGVALRPTTSSSSSLPPTTPERATTAQQPTTSSRASTVSPSTTNVAHTMAHDESQDNDSMNQISQTDLTKEESENILTLSFNGITVEDWMKHYDLIFRQYLSNTLTSNTLRVEPENIYYIEPTPLLRRNVLHVSILARYSSMKRSALPFVPLNETMAALSNLTALTAALGLKEPPSIIEGVPDFLLPTTQPPTTQPSTTRKPPPKIGFLSNPGLFISLVVIATVSIIIIIVGLIYLLCDRRRGRTGEYITNHTPRNSDLELGLDNPVMAENDKNVSNGNHLSSIKGDMESDMIVPYDNFTQEELMNYEVEDTHL